MKQNLKNKNLFAIILISLLFISCTTNDPAIKLPTSPEAIAAYDASSAGIIKGILVGSTGNFKFSVKNGNDSVYCKVTFDGNTGTLLSTDFQSWTPGQAINRAKFTGKVGTVDVVVYLSCGTDGSNTSVEFTIPGHTIVVSVIKETSTALVKGYEGTYITYDLKTNAKKDNGTFNFITKNSAVIGYHKGTDGSGQFEGTISGSTLTIGTDVLTIDETTVSGTVMNTDSKITVTGKRTL